MENRVYYIDNFKSFIVFLVIVLHSSIIYMKDVPEWWYVIDHSKSALFSIIVLLLNTFLMPSMFYASGIFTISSIQKKSKYIFILNKVKRLIIPWLIGVFFLAPIQVYFYCITRNIKIDSFWKISFFQNGYQQCHYWFLSLLFTFFFVSAMLFNFFNKISVQINENKISNNKFSVYFILINTFIYFIFSLFFSSEEWVNFKILLFQPVKVFIYFNYFILGMLCKDSFIKTDKLNFKNIMKYMFIIFLFTIIYIITKSLKTQNYILIKLLFESISFNVLEFIIMLLLLKISKKYFNENNKLSRFFTDNSYGVYYVHQYFVLGIGLILLNYNISMFSKWTIIIILSYFISNILVNIFNKITKR